MIPQSHCNISIPFLQDRSICGRRPEGRIASIDPHQLSFIMSLFGVSNRYFLGSFVFFSFTIISRYGVSSRLVYLDCHPTPVPPVAGPLARAGRDDGRQHACLVVTAVSAGASTDLVIQRSPSGQNSSATFCDRPTMGGALMCIMHVSPSFSPFNGRQRASSFKWRLDRYLTFGTYIPIVDWRAGLLTHVHFSTTYIIVPVSPASPAVLSHPSA